MVSLMVATAMLSTPLGTRRTPLLGWRESNRSRPTGLRTNGGNSRAVRQDVTVNALLDGVTTHPA